MDSTNYAKLLSDAIERFPMPKRACVWVRARVEWERDRWVKKALNGEGQG